MATRTVEIEDSLDERIKDVEQKIRDNFLEYLEEHIIDAPDDDDFVKDTYYQAQGCDTVHEAADSSTPIYYSEIDGLYYLYGNEFDEAYRNAGIGDGDEDNHRQVAIYYYLSEKGFDYLRRIEEVWDERADEIAEGESLVQYMTRTL